MKIWNVHTKLVIFNFLFSRFKIDMEKTRQQIYEWIQEKYPKKFKEEHLRDKIVDTVVKWLSVNNDNQLNTNTRYFKLLNEYFNKPEFFPYLDTDNSIQTKFNHYPILLSLCQSEPGKFKYLIVVKKTSWPFGQVIAKYKFEVLEDGRIYNLTKNNFFENYEDMKKYLITNECFDCHYSSDPREITITKRRNSLMKKSNQTDLFSNKIIYYFLSKDTSEIILLDGKINFHIYELSSWSYTITNMLSDSQIMSNDQKQIIIPVSKKIFVIYILLRLSNFLQYEISSSILSKLAENISDFPSLEDSFGVETITKNINELYRLCDYLEDILALPKLIDIIRTNVDDKYEKQKFYDMVFSYLDN